MLDGNSGTRGERVEKKTGTRESVKDDFGSMIQRGRKSFPYKL